VARLIGFFVVVLAATLVLRQVPLLGGLFRIPILGFWFAAILVSVLASKLASDALDRRRARSMERSLGATDTPHNQGKLGSFLAAQGRHRRALEKLERAVEGEPEVAEWHYRLGISRLATGDAVGAGRAFERTTELSEDHAYGQALLRLAEARTAEGRPEESLVALDRFELGHGSSPQSAYLRGRAYRRLGRSAEASEALKSVPHLARHLAAYQRREGTKWVLRAWLARLV
jgi:tetratricopeptide (TPR) repeat protein